jgi:hypothetical protein
MNAYHNLIERFQNGGLHFSDLGPRQYLAPVLALLGLFFLVGLWRQRGAYRSLHDGSADAAAKIEEHSPRPRLLRDLPIIAVWLIIATALVGAAMKPLAPSSRHSVRERALKVVVVFDVSKSTSAEDYRQSLKGPKGEVGVLTPGPFGSRLQTGALTFRRDLLPSLGGAPICFVTYRGEGWRLTPTFTTDYSALAFMESHYLREGMAPGEGSDISLGLATALEQLKRYRKPGIRELIVLFSDGGSTGEVIEDPVTKQKRTREERLEDAVSTINKDHIGFIGIGVGLEKPSPIPTYQQDREGRWQRTGVLRDGEGKDAPAILTSYEPKSLKSLAQKTGGLYHHIEDPNKKIEVDWQATLGNDMIDRSDTPVFQDILLAAMCLLAATYLLRFIFR